MSNKTIQRSMIAGLELVVEIIEETDGLTLVALHKVLKTKVKQFKQQDA